ncbi:hypothetical protein FJZ19_04755 [Candidatus Pacearchaeota archaeon]|nr:hypothetical protein [Candidatus Pacearchaeota archaeon]
MTKIINLSLPICNGMMKYPSDPEPEVKITPATSEEVRDECYGEGENTPLAVFIGTKYHSGYMELRLRNHHGTHIDAPAHKIPGGKTITDYPLEKFINDAVLIDLTTAGILAREKREISLKDLELHDLGKYEKIGALILYTGFCHESIIPAPARQDKRAFEEKFPYLSYEAAVYVANTNPRLNILGIDSFAFDPRGSNSEAHRAFFENDTLLLETLVNLAELKEYAGNNVFRLHSVPVQILNADAAWSRAYAIV